MAKWAKEAQREWQKGNVKSEGDAAEWEARKKAGRARLSRQLARAVPGYRKTRTLQQKSAQAFASALKRVLVQRPPYAGLFTPAFPEDATVFGAPYPLVDVQFLQDFDQHIQVTDRSFTIPSTGQLILDTDFDNDEDTSFSDGLWGLLYQNVAAMFVSCGVNYTVPRAGRIQVNATLKNFYNHATLSLKDNWGFSDGTLVCTYYLFASVIRPSTEAYLPQLLLSKKITSGGDDTSGVMPDVEQTSHFLEAATEATFNAGENVWVMVGTAVEVFSKLDDMHSKVRALLWWQVDQIAVSVVD